MFIQEDQLSLLEGVQVGVLIGVIGGLGGCSLVHLSGSFFGPVRVFWRFLHHYCLCRISSRFLGWASLVAWLRCQMLERMVFCKDPWKLVF
jgi:hypothetical protein